MDLTETKRRLKELGAKTTGTKATLNKRLQLWEDNNLSNTLYEVAVVPSKSCVVFPEDHLFKPISTLKPTVIVTANSIQMWFEERKATKGLYKGRILAMKLFTKYIKYLKHGDKFLIKATCAAEQKKATEYQIQIVFSNQEIQQCTCTCPAGAGFSAACKHVAAVCFSLEHFSITGVAQEYVSCTSLPVRWNKPPAGRNVGPMSFSELFRISDTVVASNKNRTQDLLNCLVNYKINSPILEGRKANASALKDHTYFQDLENDENPHTSNEEGAFFANNLDSDDSLYEEFGRKIDFVHLIYQNQKSSEMLQSLEYSIPLIAICCKNTYNSTIPCEGQEITLQTNDKVKWSHERLYRITASRCYALYTYCDSDWSNKIEKYFWPKHFKTKATEYGLAYEEEARTTYKKTYGLEVFECGLVVWQSQPWLAASPDGIVLINNNLDRLLEIKCPLQGKQFGSTDVVQHCPYLKLDVEGQLTLRKKHAYYAQVQLNMCLLNVKKCDFFVYCSFDKSSILVTIDIDFDFCFNLIKKLQTIYFNQMLPYLCKKNENESHCD